MEVVVDEPFLMERFRLRCIKLFGGVFAVRRVGACFFFIATAAATTTTATAARTTFSFIGRAIEAEPVFGGWWFITHIASRRGHEVVVFKNLVFDRFSVRFGMHFWRPIFGHPFTKTAARRTFLARWTSASIFAAIITAAAPFATATTIGTTFRAALTVARIATTFGGATFAAGLGGPSFAGTGIRSSSTAVTIARRGRRACFRVRAGWRSKQIRRQIIGQRSAAFRAVLGNRRWRVGGGRERRRRWRHFGHGFWFRFGLSDTQAQHAGELAPVARGLGRLLRGGGFGRFRGRGSSGHRLGGSGSSTRCWRCRCGGNFGSQLGGGFRGGLLRGGGRQPNALEKRSPVVFSWCISHARGTVQVRVEIEQANQYSGSFSGREVVSSLYLT